MHNLRRTQDFKKNQTKSVEIEVKLEVLDNSCKVTSALIGFPPKIMLLHLF